MSGEVTLLSESENVNCSSAYLWQLMRYTILQLLKNLRFHSHGKEITDADILEWANTKVRNSGSQSHMYSFKVTIFIALFLSFKRLLQVLAFAV
jgi:hypothetical protein